MCFETFWILPVFKKWFYWFTLSQAVLVVPHSCQHLIRSILAFGKNYGYVAVAHVVFIWVSLIRDERTPFIFLKVLGIWIHDWLSTTDGEVHPFPIAAQCIFIINWVSICPCGGFQFCLRNPFVCTSTNITHSSSVISISPITIVWFNQYHPLL